MLYCLLLSFCFLFFSGNLLFTANSEGQSFNVFLISPSIQGSSDCKVQHLYSLYRGSTTGIVSICSVILKSSIEVVLYVVSLLTKYCNIMCILCLCRYKMLLLVMTVAG